MPIKPDDEDYAAAAADPMNQGRPDGEIDARYCHVPMLGKPFSLAELESCLQTLVGCRFKPADREAA